MKHRNAPTILALWAATACQQALDLDKLSFDAEARGVLWFGLAAGPGQTCSWPRSYQLPERAQETITSATGDGDRITDSGPALVTCSVVPESGADDAYEVSIDVASAEVAHFSAAGRLSSASGATLQVAFNTEQFSLQSSNCTAAVRAVVPGALWLQNLRCLDLSDRSFPGVSCTGAGGLLFERCSP